MQFPFDHCYVVEHSSTMRVQVTVKINWTSNAIFMLLAYRKVNIGAAAAAAGVAAVEFTPTFYVNENLL